MRRINTGMSGRSRASPPRDGKRAMSWKDLAQKKPPKPALQQQKISAYRLSWEKLKAVLEEKIFPNHTFHEQLVSVEEDFYLVEIPSAMKSADFRLIEDARDATRPDVAPEPPRRESSEEPTS